VWKATGPGGFSVAMKFIPLGEAAGAVELRALELMKDARHANLLGQFGAWERDGVLVVAMELADRTLSDRLREAVRQGLPGVPRAELLEYLREAAKGLDHLNGLGVQHRDVKPQNLLLVGGSVKVADFGLAKVLEQSRASHTGAMTPAYAAPEFLRRAVSAHSDQYSLAVSYCQLRGGRLPFTGDQSQIVTGHLLDPPDLTMLPAGERPAVAKALAKQPEDRWPSCRAFAEAVAAAHPDDGDTAPQPSSVWVSPTVTRPGRRSRRPWETAALVGGLLLLTAALPVALVWSGVLRVKPGGADATDHADHSPLPQQDKDKDRATPPPAKDEDKVAAMPPDKDKDKGAATTPEKDKDKGTPPPADVTIALGKEYTNGIGMKLKRIDAGAFTMGSPDTEDGRFGDEGPQHEVEITQAFYLSVYPVTQGEYEKVIGKNPSFFSKGGSDKDKVQGLDTGRFPVENVSWDEAVAFCEALNQQDTRKPAGWSYELPREAEWEYACRAGTKSAYSFGDDPKQLADYAWYIDNSGGRTHEAGTRKPNPWGLYDMQGDVWEWCADRYGKYESGLFKDPKGPNSGESRVLRCGSWSDNPRDCRSAFRYGLDPGYRVNFIGFRVVLRPAAPRPSLRLPAVGAVTLGTGETKAVTVRVERDHCPGPVRLEMDGLPDGVSARPAVVPDGQDTADVELTAADSATLGDGRGTLTARSGDVRADGPLDVTVAPGKEFTNAIGMKLKRINAGTFTMGSPDKEDGRFDSEGPQHEVTITQPFYLGVCPVTQREYEKVIGKNPNWFSKDGGGKDKVQGLDTRRFPVENVSWDDAAAFCEALNQQDKGKPAGWAYGLPPEAEWEYACRAGTTTAYSFGDDPKQLGDYAWFWDNAEQRTHEVGTRKPNPWGLYDMHGDVWQWCADGERKYESGPIQDPKGPGGGESRVLRGGSWYNGPRNCRSAYRVVNDPGYSHFFIGFRVVLRPAARTP
jgi:formylglycine-generating enzyme required for sulfatase activity